MTRLHAFSSTASSLRLLTTLCIALAFSACDSSKPAVASPTEIAAPTSTTSKIACPSQELNAFVAAFAEAPDLQKAFTAETVDTAFVDMNAQPEPVESIEALPREKLRFPVMPNRAQQQKDGLKYREVANANGRAVVALEVPDTDAQVLYTFRRDACWTLVKIVDPAYGDATEGEAPKETADASASTLPDDSDLPQGLSTEFAKCMVRAGSQNIPRADCLMDERDRQDARLNKVYKALIGQLQGDRRTRMVEAQRAWVQVQQKDGVFEASILDELGPIGSQQQVENEARAIAQRIELLEQYLEFSKP